MRGRAVLLAVASALAIAPAAHAQAGVAFFGGTAWSARTDLTITQAGAPELAFSARWETRPFRDSPYYAARLSVLGARGGWELQLTHHKLYLANPPAEVADFQITHGFNLLTVQRSLRVRAFDVRCGLGAVIAHAESTVRGGSSSGYHATGPALVLGASRGVRLSGGLFAEGGFLASAARFDVPVSGGRARGWNVALHLQAGLGWRAPR